MTRLTTNDATRPRLAEAGVVALVLAFHGWLAITSSFGKSLAFDEVAHVGGGIMSAVEGDYRFNAESGVLPQRWAALPLGSQGLVLPPPEHPARLQGNVWALAREVLYGGANDAEVVAASARTMIAALSVVLGALVYAWSRALFGRAGGLLSLILYAASPTMLAHGRMVTADLAAALFFLLASGALWQLLERITPLRLGVAALALAGLLLTKHSGLLIAPIAAVLVPFHAWSLRPLEIRIGARSWRFESPGRQIPALACVALALMVLVALLIWAAYGFRFAADPRASGDDGSVFVHSWESQLAAAGAGAAPIALARELHLLPEAYLWGLAYTLRTTSERDAFLRGHTSKTGWWWFFPYAVAVKTPLALFVLLALALVAWIRTPGKRGDLRRALERTAPLWALAGVYGAVAVASHLNIGHRHMLPVYPVLFILAGGAAHWVELGWRRAGLARQRPWTLAAGLLTIVAVAHFAAESWRVRPHYLAYFNQLAGGPEGGYRHLVDSSLDWGQDLPALASQLEDHRAEPGPRHPVYVAYLGSAVPAYYGIEAEWLASYFPIADPARPPPPLRGGTFCVSVTLLQSVHLGTLGPWSPEREQQYRQARDLTERFLALSRDGAGRQQLAAERSIAEWMEVFANYQRLRSARLFRTLRQREPDARAGYSIHLYRLSDAEVQAALEGPVP